MLFVKETADRNTLARMTSAASGFPRRLAEVSGTYCELGSRGRSLLSVGGGKFAVVAISLKFSNLQRSVGI